MADPTVMLPIAIVAKQRMRAFYRSGSASAAMPDNPRPAAPVGDVTARTITISSPLMEHFRAAFRVDSDIEFRIRREVAAARSIRT